jgi:hypothetical protein
MAENCCWKFQGWDHFQNFPMIIWIEWLVWYLYLLKNMFSKTIMRYFKPLSFLNYITADLNTGTHSSETHCSRDSPHFSALVCLGYGAPPPLHWVGQAGFWTRWTSLQAVGKPTQIIHPLSFSTPFSSFIIIERKPKRMAETCRIGRICTSPIFTSWLVYVHVDPLLNWKCTQCKSELRIRIRMDLH